ncbi:hypothetical protein BDQ17DRAFT_1436103 [Cyathus striatus]|nr:hypothetical protein BDQ17DRAFT_1436103 [Cyathus striatus]
MSSGSRCSILVDRPEDHHTRAMICIYCEATRGNWIIAHTQTYTHPTFTYAQYEMKVAWPASGSAFALGNTSLTASCSAITLFHLLADGSCPTTPPSPTSNIPLLYFKSALTVCHPLFMKMASLRLI